MNWKGERVCQGLQQAFFTADRFAIDDTRCEAIVQQAGGEGARLRVREVGPDAPGSPRLPAAGNKMIDRHHFQ